jgi:CPA1 family monovalent cation:H+ antiporter
MSLYDVAAILIGLAAVFGYLNHRYLRLPHTIGLVLIAMAASIAVILLDLAVPALRIGEDVTDLLARIHFHETLMHGMLSFMLFAGALHVDFTAMADRKWAIASLASVGTLISTFLIGTAMWALFNLFGVEMPYVWALVFGALISPTDPVAVLSIFKTVDVPPPLQAKIAGESLFNDGVGVVVFTILLAVAVGGEHGTLGGLEVVELFLLEAGGGALLGLVAGYIGYRAMHSIDEYVVEIVISLALVMVTYSLAIATGMSGPLAMVVAGLYIGNRGVRYAMSETTRQHLLSFWSLIDEVLNSVLFLLIGLEVLVVSFNTDYLAAALLAVPVALAGRFVSVAVPITTLSARTTFTKGAVPVLVWGGLRGGIAVALALSLPESAFKAPILTTTYAVVLFSIVVQGLTIKPLVEKVVREKPASLGE